MMNERTTKTAHHHLSDLPNDQLVAELRALGTDDEDNDAPHLYAHEAADRLEGCKCSQT